MTETKNKIDMTPSPRGYARMLWAIATNSENADDRVWAKKQLIEGYVRGAEAEWEWLRRRFAPPVAEGRFGTLGLTFAGLVRIAEPLMGYSRGERNEKFNKNNDES